MTNVTPASWHTVTPRIVVEDPAGLVAFLKRVFGATGELQGDAPAQIVIGDSRLMVSRAGPREAFRVSLRVRRGRRCHLPASAGCGRRITGSGVGHAVWRSPWNGEGPLG